MLRHVPSPVCTWQLAYFFFFSLTNQQGTAENEVLTTVLLSMHPILSPARLDCAAHGAPSAAVAAASAAGTRSSKT